MRQLLRPLAVLALAVGVAVAADKAELDAHVAGTDMSNADSVFTLAQWCAANNFTTSARKYYNAVIALDRDHEGARTALGQVKVGDRWVAASLVGGPAKVEGGGGSGNPGGGGAPAAAQRQAAGPGPTAAQIPWDLTVPKDPQPGATFINSYIERMPRVGNDSRDMDVSISTILMDENYPYGFPRLCAALLRKDFTDIYGATMLLGELQKKGKTADAKKLLGFIVKASEHVTDAEDLATFAYSVGMMRDKRVVPRLIELLETGSADVRSSAAQGLSMLTMLPEASITPDKAKEWWALNHNVSEQQIFQEQLRSPDPKVAVSAAQALYGHRDRAIVPVLITLMRGDDKAVCEQAVAVIKQITGLDWDYVPTASPADKKKVCDRLDEWWKREHASFIWVEDAKNAASQPQTKQDPCEGWVAQLGSLEGNQSQQAEANLLGKGTAAVPALLNGLGSPTVLVRRKSADLLRQITKQDIAFDARAGEEERAKGVAAWTAYARKAKLIPDDGAGEEGAEAPAK